MDYPFKLFQKVDLVSGANQKVFIIFYGLQQDSLLHFRNRIPTCANSLKKCVINQGTEW